MNNSFGMVTRSMCCARRTMSGPPCSEWTIPLHSISSAIGSSLKDTLNPACTRCHNGSGEWRMWRRHRGPPRSSRCAAQSCQAIGGARAQRTFSSSREVLDEGPLERGASRIRIDERPARRPRAAGRPRLPFSYVRDFITSERKAKQKQKNGAQSSESSHLRRPPCRMSAGCAKPRTVQ